MIKISPNHLFNQEITLISGGRTFDEDGEPVYSEQITSSGAGRLEFEDVRVVTAAGIVLATNIRAYVDPTLSGAIGDFVGVDGQRFKINNVRKMIDGRGFSRLNVFILEEVGE